MSEYAYPGEELDLFQHAINWKRYYARKLHPYIQGTVLEVGAGIGGTGRILCTEQVSAWTCLEPDPRLARRLEMALATSPLPAPTRVLCGTIDAPDIAQTFDTILYIDVLEHIQDDGAELTAAARLLNPHGHLIVLSPAHAWLFNPFDQAIGHWRRYSRRMLLGAAPRDLRVVRVWFLDSVGILASLANRWVLKRLAPTLSQIHLWDSRLVPISRVLDPLTGHRLGKTIVAVWTRD